MDTKTTGIKKMQAVIKEMKQDVMYVDSRSGIIHRLKSKKVRVQLDAKRIACRLITIFKDNDRVRVRAEGYFGEMQEIFFSFPYQLEAEIVLTPCTSLKKGRSSDVIEIGRMESHWDIKVPFRVNLTDYLSDCKLVVVSREDNGYKVYGHYTKNVLHKAVYHGDDNVTQVTISPDPTGRWVW